jgi:hypothetical protein
VPGHPDGQLTGWGVPGIKQESWRAGGLPLRIRNRVYFPITSDLVTNTLSMARVRKVRPSRRLIRVSRDAGRLGAAPVAARMEIVRLADLNGHPRPLQRIRTEVPGGAFTVSRRILAPRRDVRPAMRTTGKGLMRLKALTAGLTAAPTATGTMATCLAFVVTWSPTG